MNINLNWIIDQISPGLNRLTFKHLLLILIVFPKNTVVNWNIIIIITFTLECFVCSVEGVQCTIYNIFYKLS